VVTEMTASVRAPGGAAALQVIAALREWRAARRGVLVLAVDGPGGSGKSTIAAAVAAATGAALVHTDDFFWPLSPGPGLALDPPGLVLARYYDWPRLRAEALGPLREGRPATFRRFDWERGTGLADRVTVRPAPLIVLEGVFSAAPQLADLVDRATLVDTPEDDRLVRLRARIAPEEWDGDWLVAERAYFGAIRPPDSFDLVVAGTSPDPAGTAPPAGAAPADSC
jgi:uridine kinase